MSKAVISTVSSDWPVKWVEGFTARILPCTLASRGTTTLSPTLIALSSVPRKVSPTLLVSELNGSVSLTDSLVPEGTVTVTGAGGAAGVVELATLLLVEAAVSSLYVLGFVELERAGLL